MARGWVTFAFTILPTAASAQSPVPVPVPVPETAAVRRVSERPETGGRPPPPLTKTRSGYRHEGSAFDAEIDRDGRVSFDDHAPVRWVPPRLAFREAPVTPLPQPDGSDPAAAPQPALKLLEFRFDLTEIFTRLRGEDPHPHRRLWFLRETEGLRDRLADETRREEMDRALAEVRPRMRRVWRDRRRPPPARRAEIFDAWDECEEGTRGGETARREIEEFVRERLPCGTPEEFAEEELRALNARRASRRAFAPYEPAERPTQ